MKKLRAQVEELKKNTNNLMQSQYSHYRDENGKLIVTFFNGKKSIYPLVPLRQYQIDDQIAIFKKGYKRLLLQRPRRSGKETETWQFLISSAIEKPGLYIMNYPTNVRASAVVWAGRILFPQGKSCKV